MFIDYVLNLDITSKSILFLLLAIAQAFPCWPLLDKVACIYGLSQTAYAFDDIFYESFFET